MKRYVKDMSGHKFAERGGGILQICVFMTDIHIIVDLQTNGWEHFFQTLSFVNSFVKSDFFHLPNTNTPIH